MSFLQTTVVLVLVSMLVAAIVAKYNGRIEVAMLRADIECALEISDKCWQDNLKPSQPTSGDVWKRTTLDSRMVRVTYGHALRGDQPSTEMRNLVLLGGRREGGFVVFERLIASPPKGRNKAFRYLVNEGYE